MNITIDEVKANHKVRTYIERADESLIALGYTEHSYAHVTHVAQKAREILETLGYPQRDCELAELFLKKDGVLGTLAAVEIDGRVQITDGLLKNYQGKVIKMDKRKQMAEIQLDIAGDVTSVWLSYEILEGQTET